MMRKTINLLSEFSIPLITGVVLALILANVIQESYEHFLHEPLINYLNSFLAWVSSNSFSPLPMKASLFGLAINFEVLNFHFLMNDIFMVFFFGIAAVEITQSVLPGGSLNPMSKAANPLMGTLGGVFGPIAFFFLFSLLFNADDAVYRGWGIPTATDIALAWLVARLIFGSKHPAVAYLLLLAIADDAIGLVIIAVFYPDPNNPVEVYYLGFTVLGMLVSMGFRLLKINSFWPYLLVGGFLSWVGLIKAHLHPALALVFIIPFLPHSDSKTRYGTLFSEEEHLHSPLESFEHSFKYFVDIGLLGFGLANAGVAFAGISEVTWIVLLSLIVGKLVGIGFFSLLAVKLGMSLPDGMSRRDLYVAALIAAIGLTVALFVAGEAFTDPGLQGAAKMGAVFSGGVAALAVILAKVLGVKKLT